MEKTINLKITSDRQTVNIPYAMQGIHLRVNWLRYRTALGDKKILHIRVVGFDNNIFVGDGQMLYYTKAIMLPSTVNEDVFYDNESAFFDVTLNAVGSSGLNSITIESYIDGVFAGNNISVLNPLYLEITVR